MLQYQDFVISFFGVFLSIVFSQGLNARIVRFVDELSFSIMPFGYTLGDDSGSKLTKAMVAKINEFDVDRARKILRLDKSITCNSSIIMAMLVVTTALSSFMYLGNGVSSFDVIWANALLLMFVYISYFIWRKTRDRKYWQEMPPLSVSRYNLLLSIFAIAIALYVLMDFRDVYSPYTYSTAMVIIIFFSVKISRIPHINITYRRARDFSEGEQFYLHDSNKELLIYTAIFLILFILHLFLYSLIKDSDLGNYVNNHPVRFLTIFWAFPVVIFLIQFVRIVRISSIMSLVTFVAKPKL